MTMAASFAVASVPIPLGFWQGGGIILDTMESYSAVEVDALNGGSQWLAAYEDKPNSLGVWSHDTIETYSNGVDLNGLNGVHGFSAAYADRTGDLGIYSVDSMESYADAAAVDGLNGSQPWGSAYDDR